MSNRILLVEDDEALGEQVAQSLSQAGFEPHWLRDGDVARRVEPDDYRAIILDLMLPGTYGMDLLKQYRKTSEVPVLILSARDDTADKIRGLKLGADDYVTKPFFPEELIARVHACLRRPNFVETSKLTIGAIQIDFEARQVWNGDALLALTQVEFDIVALLARRKGAVVSRDAIVDAVLDASNEGSRRTLDVHISRIRNKLGDAATQLETVWGIGYRLGEGS